MADVLVVEDDFPTRNNFPPLLNKNCDEALSAISGKEALGIIKNKTPDLITSGTPMYFSILLSHYLNNTL